MQTTLILLKPDTVERGLIGKVISRIEDKGLTIVGMKMMQLSDAIINEHYDFLMDKPFFPNIQKYMKRTPVIAMAVKGKEAIKVIRTIIGATNPAEAAPGSIRGDYGLTVDANIIHASDSPENAKIELERFFGNEGIYHYEKLLEQVV